MLQLRLPPVGWGDVLNSSAAWGNVDDACRRTVASVGGGQGEGPVPARHRRTTLASRAGIPAHVEGAAGGHRDQCCGRPLGGAGHLTADRPNPRRGVIGEGETLDGPYGRRRITYADYTASGRSLDFVEEFIRDHVLTRYANTHTESSGTGLQTTRLREEARRLIRDAVGGTDEDLVIFCGSGATAAVNSWSPSWSCASRLGGPHATGSPRRSRRRAAGGVPGALRTPLQRAPWRESIADIVIIDQDAHGHIDLDRAG